MSGVRGVRGNVRGTRGKREYPGYEGVKMDGVRRCKNGRGTKV